MWSTRSSHVKPRILLQVLEGNQINDDGDGDDDDDDDAATAAAAAADDDGYRLYVCEMHIMLQNK